MLDALIIESGDNGWTTLHVASAGSFSFELPEGFPTEIVADVLLAAGLATQRNGELCTTTWAGCQRLGETVLQVLAYFDPPGEPSAELQRIRADLVSAVPDEEVATLSTLSVAWLDWAIRQDIAEAAGNLDPWESDRITINVAPIRSRRLTELLSRTRLEQEQPAEPGVRLAPSARQRRSNRHFRTG